MWGIVYNFFARPRGQSQGGVYYPNVFVIPGSIRLFTSILSLSLPLYVPQLLKGCQIFSRYVRDCYNYGAPAVREK